MSKCIYKCKKDCEIFDKPTENCWYEDYSQCFMASVKRKSKQMKKEFDS